MLFLGGISLTDKYLKLWWVVLLLLNVLWVYRTVSVHIFVLQILHMSQSGLRLENRSFLQVTKGWGQTTNLYLKAVILVVIV